jgi:hypothetical protein
MSVELGLRLGLGDEQRSAKGLAGTVEGATDIKGQARLKSISGALGGTQIGQHFSDAKRDKRTWGQVGNGLGVLAGSHCGAPLCVVPACLYLRAVVFTMAHTDHTAFSPSEKGAQASHLVGS